MVRMSGDLNDVVLPQGVETLVPTTHSDERGTLAEVYRASWPGGFDVVQWTLTHSAPNTLRGMHLHLERQDFVLLAAGRMLLALHDLRRESPTFGMTSTVPLDAGSPCGVRIPTGVAHGFYFEEAGSVLVGTSEYWDPADEFGCRWDAPEFGIDWPCSRPLLSARDERAGSYAELVAVTASRPA